MSLRNIWNSIYSFFDYLLYSISKTKITNEDEKVMNKIISNESVCDNELIIVKKKLTEISSVIFMNKMFLLNNESMIDRYLDLIIQHEKSKRSSI